MAGFETLGTWHGLLLLFILQGVRVATTAHDVSPDSGCVKLGRGVWEATNKSVFAEYFEYDTLVPPPGTVAA